MSALDAPLLLRRLEPGDPLGDLTRLFLLGADLEVEHAARALAPADLAAFRRGKLIEQEGDRVRAPVRVVPFQGLRLLHDREDGVLRRDHVAGIGPASRTLAALTLRRAVATALDLGTGCGVQALLVGRQSDRVVALDVNPRAARFTEFNARLNGLHNVECRIGDLFAPVRGSSFDLVVANPPFVVSPDSLFVFRDSPEPGDAISRTVVSQIPAFLTEGGFAHVLVSWVCPAGGDWSAVPRQWIAGSPCDGWLLRYRTEDPLTYAATWNDPIRRRDPEAFRATLDRWLDYYRSAGIKAIATGAVILRRRSGPNWVRADDMPYGPSGQAGEHILRVFDAGDFLDTLQDDRELLDETFELVDGHRLEQTLDYRDGGYQALTARLRLDDGAGIAAPVTPDALHLLFRLDGSRSLGRILQEAAEDTGLDHEVLARQAVVTARELLARGFLRRGPGIQKDAPVKKPARARE